MKLIAWNSLGANWDLLADRMAEVLQASPTVDLLCLLVEAGWAPWVRNQKVEINAIHDLDSWKTYFDANGAANSRLCQRIMARRGNIAFWVPWVANLNAMKTNSRCSMGGAFIHHHLVFHLERTIPNDNYLRPFVLASISAGGRHRFTVVQVHLISGNPVRARQQLGDICQLLAASILPGSSALIVGDINIDLLTTPIQGLPHGWRVLNTGHATHYSMTTHTFSELDYGILYDPHGTHVGASIQEMRRFYSNGNPSDHSVMEYDFPAL